MAYGQRKYPRISGRWGGRENMESDGGFVPSPSVFPSLPPHRIYDAIKQQKIPSTVAFFKRRLYGPVNKIFAVLLYILKNSSTVLV